MKVNGKNVPIGNMKVVTDLIHHYELNKDKIVIEIDKKIIPKEQYDKFALNDENSIEVISFVAGG
ncbi:sulfur carrier protein ThiS [Clostridium sp. BJN0001]|uniref:sulfur carrier protein ThiS n=1 Tax=Clostridium sp. BJN0001 TaxID=2930219 RepID=UPI001FD27707|nr:sulfur carrier protein ThiS [Clostridium sp. BJN0001]